MANLDESRALLASPPKSAPGDRRGNSSIQVIRPTIKPATARDIPSIATNPIPFMGSLWTLGTAPGTVVFGAACAFRVFLLRLEFFPIGIRLNRFLAQEHNERDETRIP